MAAKLSPTIVGSAWSAVAAEVVLVMLVLAVPPFTVAVIFIVALFPADKSPIVQIPDVTL